VNTTRLRALGAAAAVLATTLAAVTVPASSAAASGDRWTGSWAAAQQHPRDGWEYANWSLAGFADQSVRQVVRLSAGGSQVRIRLSNRYGSAPLRVTGATIAKAGDGAAVRPGSSRRLTFDRSGSTTIPAGRDLTSDPVPLPVAPLEKLTVTLYFAAPTGPATFHESGLTTTYRAAGDHRFDHGGAAFTGETTQSWYYLTAVSVTGGPHRPTGTVVAFGDSLTDGYGSTPGADNRYPDQLAERLAIAGRRLAVVNAGIGGNLLLTDHPCYAGDKGIDRFARDALSQPGVRTVIVLEGVNDIGIGGMDVGCAKPPVATASNLINGYRTLIRAAHARGVTVIGATLTPFKGSGYHTEQHEAVRDEVNQWIRTSGEYDAVADLDRILADPADPDALLPAYDFGDGLHHTDAGALAIAAAIPLNTL
jgi:lysophospholipase L1-like esterase